MTARLLGPVLVALGALALWELVCRVFSVDPALLPPPSSVMRAIVDDRGVLLPGLVTTATEAVAGLVVAALLGGLFGVLISQLRPVRVIGQPLLVLSQTIPIIAIAPLLVTAFGFGVGPKIAVVTLIAVFPITVAVTDGVRQADVAARELLRGTGAGRLAQLRLLELPAAVPAIVSGARVAALLVVPGAVAAEWVGATGGLGQQLLIYNNDGRAVLSYACVMLLALLGLALWLAVLLLDAALTRRGLLGVDQAT